MVDKKEADFPLLSDPSKEVATKYGVLMANGQMANRWTFYIDKSGKVVAIDTAVRPATSAEDMITKLAELGATATPMLATAASDTSSNPRARRAALTALGESRTALAADPILAGLSDPDPWLRLTAHQAAACLALALAATDPPSTQAVTHLDAARTAARATETDPLILRLR